MKLKWVGPLTIAGALAVAAVPLDSTAQQSDQRMQQQNQRSQQQRNQNQRSGKKQNTQAKQQGQQQGQQTQAVVAGEVVDSREVNIVGNGASQHRLIKVRPQKGSTVVVDLGPVSQNQNIPEFEQGERIIAVGKSGRINNQPVIYAMTVGELYPAGRGAAGQQMAQDGRQQGQR